MLPLLIFLTHHKACSHFAFTLAHLHEVPAAIGGGGAAPEGGGDPEDSCVEGGGGLEGRGTMQIV